MFDDIMKQFEDAVAEIDETIRTAGKEVLQTLRRSQRNRVKRMVVYDDLGREAGTLERTPEGWAWSAYRLAEFGPEATRSTGQSKHLREAVDQLMRRLHGIATKPTPDVTPET